MRRALILGLAAAMTLTAAADARGLRSKGFAAARKPHAATRHHGMASAKSGSHRVKRHKGFSSLRDKLPGPQGWARFASGEA
ncbi:MAG: hypothetical protein JWP73_1385 [Phenylobacterium sp.]|nr:hypothetical protein [Phenylobacterium sp.]